MAETKEIRHKWEKVEEGLYRCECGITKSVSFEVLSDKITKRWFAIYNDGISPPVKLAPPCTRKIFGQMELF